MKKKLNIRQLLEIHNGFDKYMMGFAKLIYANLNL